MNEQHQSPQERPAGGGNFDGHFNDDASDGQPVTVSCGPYLEQLPVSNRTVGEIRRRFGGRLDIDPQSRAVVDGVEVDNGTVVRAGQALMFTRPAGEKGAGPAVAQQNMLPLPPSLNLARRWRARNSGDEVHLKGAEASAVSPEGQRAGMPLRELLECLRPGGIFQNGGILPDGAKGIWTRGPAAVVALERAPAVHSLTWIAPDSPAPYGRGATYRQARIALPYVVILAVFTQDHAGRLQLTERNECFFRVNPLKPGDEDLSFPALLNCSKFTPPEGKPLSWICTQHLRRTQGMHANDPRERLWAGCEALRHCLLETAFNYSSENHEGSSWFTESRGADPRVASIEAWEKATAENATFVLDVPWLPAGLTLNQVAQRILENLRLPAVAPQFAGDLARIIFNHR